MNSTKPKTKSLVPFFCPCLRDGCESLLRKWRLSSELQAQMLLRINDGMGLITPRSDIGCSLPTHQSPDVPIKNTQPPHGVTAEQPSKGRLTAAKLCAASIRSSVVRGAIPVGQETSRRTNLGAVTKTGVENEPSVLSMSQTLTKHMMQLQILGIFPDGP